MSGGRRNDEKEEEGWGSTFFKIAGAAASMAAVVGDFYSVLNQPQAEVTPYGVRQPDHEVVILKVDGSLLPGKAGCGGYLSSASQNWICGFSQKLDPSLREDETKKQAILKGLKWVREKGKRKVEAKSDNFGVVNLVNSGRISNDSVICEIRDLLNSSDWEAKLSWIPGDQNSVANRLAHRAHGLPSFHLCEIDSPPQNCSAVTTAAVVGGAAVAIAAVVGGLYSVRNPQVVILKVDGSLLPGKAGCGGYLSSASQKWICGFSQKLDPSLREDETERHAILKGLKWVREKGKRKVEVKSDNFGVVNLVKSASRPRDDSVICEIRDLLKRTDWEAKLSWIPGDQNKVADELADKAHGLTSFNMCEVDSPPQKCVGHL